MTAPLDGDAAVRAALLDRLLRVPEPATIDALGAGLGLDPAGVGRCLDDLAEAGCVLDRHPQHGVRLRTSGLGAWAEYLRWRDGQSAPRVFEVYRRTATSQDLVRRLIETLGAGADRAIVVVDEQTAGRGRLGRRWVAPAGSAVLFSRAWVEPPDGPASTVDRLMLASAVAVARALEAATAPHPPAIGIRWPNDIVVEGRKLAGILVERFSPAHRGAGIAAVLGIGINVGLSEAEIPAEPSLLRHTATSLAMCGCHVDRLRVLAETIAALDAALAGEDEASLVRAWRDRSVLLSRRVSLLAEGRTIRGQVVDLDPCAGLVVRLDDGSLAHLPGATTSLLDY